MGKKPLWFPTKGQNRRDMRYDSWPHERGQSKTNQGIFARGFLVGEMWEIGLQPSIDFVDIKVINVGGWQC